jgi:hypothetical protein
VEKGTEFDRINKMNSMKEPQKAKNRAQVNKLERQAIPFILPKSPALATVTASYGKFRWGGGGIPPAEGQESAQQDGPDDIDHLSTLRETAIPLMVTWDCHKLAKSAPTPCALGNAVARC